MPNVCLGCWEMYRISLDYCPKKSCYACPVVEIDELMYPIIKILNDKGYATDNCCSGHVYHNSHSAYISFGDFIQEELDTHEIERLFTNLPKGWKAEKDKLVLRYELDRTKSETDLY